MRQYRQTSRTLFDALPHVKAEDLRPGDLLIHRGRAGFDEGGARPVLRVETVPDDREWVRIFQPITPGRFFPDGESAIRAQAAQLVTIAPPYWPANGETRTITEQDVRAAHQARASAEAEQ
ncbi:hypothetical protein PV377_44505 [Streptomyces ipomoeae]|uniref:hypothetical protein n=1 Tax=Streptomyces ipomoeae TaxID=103232 RepID=UPI0029B35B2C|nr:hypothetical protein [Streptomyces ipomoeae]MDX2845903.1 hypothetical protein [Streptomyces ipomoeae]